jgi:hypothetical protein
MAAWISPELSTTGGKPGSDAISAHKSKRIVLWGIVASSQ